MILQPYQPLFLTATKSRPAKTNILFVLCSAAITWLLRAPALQAASCRADGQYTDLAKMLRSKWVPTIGHIYSLLCLGVELGGNGDGGYPA